MKNSMDHELADRAPTFIVGPSRSGTSMVRELLNGHDSVWITRETHYFDDLRTRFRGREAGPLSAEEARRCEAYFLARGHLAYGATASADQSSIDRKELAQEAAQLGAGPDAYFEAFCRLRARANDRTRWGEKTPRHAFRIEEMLTAFPSARIVCLIRDPRAVVASYRDWTARAALAPELDTPFSSDRRRARRSYHVVLASLMWRSATQASLAARRQYGPERILLQSYEKLVSEPESSTRGLCEWLGLSYQPAMLDVPLVQSSYAPGEQRGISIAPLARWREKLTPAEVSVIQSSCRELMREFGYEPAATKIAPLRTATAYFSLPAALVRAGLANRKRMGKAGAYVARRLRFSLERTG
jgi:Sulfotransferase family